MHTAAAWELKCISSLIVCEFLAFLAVYLVILWADQRIKQWMATELDHVFFSMCVLLPHSHSIGPANDSNAGVGLWSPEALTNEAISALGPHEALERHP